LQTQRTLQQTLTAIVLLGIALPSYTYAQSAAAGQVVVQAQQAAQVTTGNTHPANVDAGLGTKDEPGKHGTPKTPAGQQPTPSGVDKTSAAKPASAGEAAAGAQTSKLGPLAPSTPPTNVPHNRPVIGIALGGGGALAMSEIGTLQWLEDHHIPVDVIAGTSMGSILAALYSTGHTPQEMEHILTQDNVNRVFRISSNYAALNYRRREDEHEIPSGITIGLKHGVSLRNSLLTDTGLDELLDREFLRYNDQTDFNNLPIPFRCQATDLNAAKTVTFSRGSLPDAVRASASIPGVFRPFQLNGHEFVDGAILENLPTPDVKAMGADVIIAVSLPLEPVGKGDLDSILGVLQRAFAVGIENNEARDRKLANVLIMPDISGFTANDYLATEKLAARGYAAAEAQKAELMKYSVSQAEWNAYIDHKKSLERPPANDVIQVKVKAPNEEVTDVVYTIFKPLVGKPVNVDEIEKKLAILRADGRYDADYTVGYDGSQSDNPIILVSVNDKKTGPPFLDLGLDIEAQTGGDTRATFATILNWQDVGGYGSGFRAKFDIGYLTQFEAEYYWKPQPLGPFFLAPRANITRQPYYIYQNNYRLSERQSQFTGGGGDVGWTDGKFQELRLGWADENVQWNTTTGSDGLPNYNANSQTARARYVFDDQDRALVPSHGIRTVFTYGELYDTPGSPDSQRFTGQFEIAQTLSKKNLFLANAEGGAFFNHDVAQPFRFTLGGPLRLAASSIDQYRGTEYFLVTPGYLRRLATLPAPLGQSIYVGGTYEFGQMRAPDESTINRQDFYIGIVAETPFGVITLAPAIGDHGEHKFVFTLGKFF
jgi:NTE family protein